MPSSSSLDCQCHEADLLDPADTLFDFLLLPFSVFYAFTPMADRNIQIRIAATGGDQSAQELRKVESASSSAATGIKELNQQGERVSMSSASMRMGLQNVGYQVQDFAVQVSSGTSAARAFAQQAPQLLSAFGPWGVGLGTVVALGAPLISQLFQQEEGLNRVSSAMTDAEQKTIKLANASREAYEAEDQRARRTYELDEALREITSTQGGYNDALRKELDLLKERQNAQNQIADARGQRELEAAAGDPLQQEQIRNRLRREAQARELQQIEDANKKRDELLRRDFESQQSIQARGKPLVEDLQAQSRNAGQQALELEQRKALAEGRAAYWEQAQKRTTITDKEREGFGKEADYARKDAEEYAARAKQLRALESELAESSRRAEAEISKTVESLQKEMDKLGDAMAAANREIETKKQIFAERDAAGSMRESRISADVARKRDQEAAQESARREREQASADLERERGTLNDMATARGSSIFARGARTGNKALQTIGGRLADGTSAVELDKISREIVQQQSALGASNVAALQQVLAELKKQAARMETMEAQVKNMRTKPGR
jgi:hypothetical protein